MRRYIFDPVLAFAFIAWCLTLLLMSCGEIIDAEANKRIDSYQLYVDCFIGEDFRLTFPVPGDSIVLENVDTDLLDSLSDEEFLCMQSLGLGWTCKIIVVGLSPNAVPRLDAPAWPTRPNDFARDRVQIYLTGRHF